MRDTGTQFLFLDSRYIVGITAFDEEHYHILTTIDKLFTAVDTKKEQIIISSLLEDFVKQTKTHFISEENLMTSTSYPGYTAHKNMHDIFMNKILLYRRNHLDGNISFASERVAYFRRWFKDHILEADKLYASFVQTQSLNEKALV